MLLTRRTRDPFPFFFCGRPSWTVQTWAGMSTLKRCVVDRTVISSYWRTSGKGLELGKVLSCQSGLAQDMALHASPAGSNCFSTVHSTSFCQSTSSDMKWCAAWTLSWIFAGLWFGSFPRESGGCSPFQYVWIVIEFWWSYMIFFKARTSLTCQGFL